MRQAGWGVVALVMALWAAPALAAEPVSHGRFENVPVHLPEGPVQRVVLWFAGSGDAGQRQRRLQALRADGAMVVDIDTAHLYRVLAKEGDRCGFSAGDVENFSRYVQALQHVPTYRLPILGGDGDGAALAYAVATQAEPEVFAGLLTEGFQPRLRNATMICGDAIKDSALQPQALRFPWLTAHAASTEGFVKQVPWARQFALTRSGSALPGERAAAKVLGAQRGISLPPVPHELDGLPLVELPTDKTGDTFAIFVSGDGGWAGLDKEVAGRLSEAGIPVVGMDSLRYFWSERTPAGFAADLDRIATHYARQWQRPNLVLIGFSQGADVLPAAINQLPSGTAQRLRMTALLSVGERADYEFHVSNWISSSDDGLPIAPEMRRLSPKRTLCVYGEEDDDALCPKLPAGTAQLIKLPGDHHFKGDYATLATTVLRHLQAMPAAAK